MRRWCLLPALFLLCLYQNPGYSDEFLFEPPKNFTLSNDYIAVNHPVNTKSETAQLYFNQGLTFVYAFNHEAAYWSFLKAAEADPNLAMAYWGQALVLGSNINIEISPNRQKIAIEAVQKAAQLAGNGPDNEKAYISALQQRYSNDVDKKQLAVRYSEAMKQVTDQYPDDPDASVLYAESLLDISPWSQWSLDGVPEKGTNEAIAALELVLLNQPMHLGANHYYIHVMEASPYPYRALMSADRLKTLLPSSGHILHMPSHIYILVGDYEQAVSSNEKAIAADKEYAKQYGMGGIYIVHYLSHNYHFLSQAYSMQGNYKGAKQAAQQLLDLYSPHFNAMPELEQYASTLMFVFLRFHQWKELLNLPEEPEAMRITKALRHFGRGAAFAGLGNTSQAHVEQKKMLSAIQQVPDAAKYGNNDASHIFKLAQYYLEGVIAEAENRSDKAIESLKKAVVEQDKIKYDEPPNWLFSVRDTLGAILLKTKQYAEAEAVFRADLRLHPKSGRSLFGLKESLKGQSKMADYYWVNEAYQKAWSFSDTELNLDNL